jgi:simple sugar transport system permease protein
VSSYIADLVVALSLLCVLVGGFVARFRIRFAAAPHAAREGG